MKADLQNFKEKVLKKFKISFVHLSKASSWDSLKLLDSNFLSFFALGFWTWSHPVDMKWSMIRRQPSRRQSSIYKVELYRNLLGYILRLSYSSSKQILAYYFEKIKDRQTMELDNSQNTYLFKLLSKWPYFQQNTSHKLAHRDIM